MYRTFVRSECSAKRSVVVKAGLGIGWIAQNGHPVVSFFTLRGVNFDACQLKRAFTLSLVAALERVHTKPQAKEVEPVLGGLTVSKRAFDPQVGFDDAVDRFGGTTGADNALQDAHQALSQSQEGGVVSDNGLQQSEGLLSRFAIGTVTIDHGPVVNAKPEPPVAQRR